jgi:hypothetical protein
VFVRATSWLVSASVAVAVLGAAGQPAGEYRLKAAFVLRFPQFVEWPRAVLDRRPAIDVCVLRPSPFGTALAQLLEGQNVAGRPFRLHEITQPVQVDDCLVLFASADAPGRSAILRRAATQPLLTIGDTPGFLDEGGIVSLRVVGTHIRFEISDVAARRAGLRLSSQLLRLALDVREGPS